MIRTLLLLILGTTLIFLAFVFSKQPQTDRAWIPEQARTASATVTATSTTIHNLRNWTYDKSAPLSKEWTDITVDPNTITRAWFLIEPFSAIEAIGHTFLSFEFEDGTVLSFSVEARREEGEAYSALNGQFRAYELSYQWGTERDFVSRRLVYLDHPLRLYPLELEPAAAQALFKTLVTETNELAATPRFYNTLTANCTNVLAAIINKHYPDRLPYDIAWNLTGYADRYLMDQGLIEMTGTKEEARANADLTPHRNEIAAMATSSPSVFSTFVRSLYK